MAGNFNFYIYPNTSDERNLASKAANVLNGLTDDLLDHFGNNGHDISVSVNEDYDEKPDIAGIKQLNYSSNKKFMMDNWRKYVWQNLAGNGVHLLVLSEYGGGYADGGAGKGNTAWLNKTSAIAGHNPNSNNFNHFKNVCIQEVFHPYLDESLRKVKELIGPRGGNLPLGENEHALGTVNSNNEQTPMVTSYVNTGLAAQGVCQSLAQDNGYTTNITSCTKNGLLYTYEERASE